MSEANDFKEYVFINAVEWKNDLLRFLTDFDIGDDDILIDVEAAFYMYLSEFANDSRLHELFNEAEKKKEEEEKKESVLTAAAAEKQKQEKQKKEEAKGV